MRDRDEGGRARNARPRDAYGRPLPHDAVGEDRVPDDYTAPPAEALAEAQRLLDADRPFHAHEVLEAAWKAAPGAERDLWQGLAQLAVGFTHVRRGNARGARTLLRRAADRIAPYAGSRDDEPQDDTPGAAGPQDAGPPGGAARAAASGDDRPREGAPYGIAAGRLVLLARELADRIERGGLGAVTDADLAPRLRS